MDREERVIMAANGREESIKNGYRERIVQGLEKVIKGKMNNKDKERLRIYLSDESNIAIMAMNMKQGRLLKDILEENIIKIPAEQRKIMQQVSLNAIDLQQQGQSPISPNEAKKIFNEIPKVAEPVASDSVTTAGKIAGFFGGYFGGVKGTVMRGKDLAGKMFDKGDNPFLATVLAAVTFVGYLIGSIFVGGVKAGVTASKTGEFTEGFNLGNDLALADSQKESQIEREALKRIADKDSPTPAATTPTNATQMAELFSAAAKGMSSGAQSYSATSSSNKAVVFDGGNHEAQQEKRPEPAGVSRAQSLDAGTPAPSEPSDNSKRKLCR